MLRVATIPPLTDMHAEDAAFLWTRRGREIDGPFLDASDIGRIDQRLEANLEGLMAAGEAGWQAALRRFGDYPEPGELFVLGTLALRWADDDALAKALDAGRALADDGLRALSGAIVRAPKENLRGHLPKWIDSRDHFLCNLSLAALNQHRADLGTRLPDLLASSDRGVRSRAIRLAGATGRADMLPSIVQALEADDEQERMAAARAACLLGESRLAHPVLDRLTLGGGVAAAECMELRLLTTPAEAGKRWLQTQLGKPHLRAAAVRVTGLFGDKAVMPWLIDRMREPESAEAAGLALRDLFDIDFGDTNLFTVDPESLGEAFAKVGDATLPVADAVAEWWDGGRGGGRDMRPFRSMRRERLDALRQAISEPTRQFENWRRTRRFPMWM